MKKFYTLFLVSIISMTSFQLKAGQNDQAITKETITSNVIPPGTGNIEHYIENSDYEEYILENNGEYYPINTIFINRKITLKAENPVGLPKLDSCAVISNKYHLSNLISLEDGAELTLEGIELDGGDYAEMAISSASKTMHNVIEGLTIDRCRIHSVTMDLIGGSKTDTVTYKAVNITNTFAYDAGEHGLYFKDVYAEDGQNDPYVFKNITFWNLGQQLIWIQVLTDDSYQQFYFDHMTGWNLSTDKSVNKELIGNSSGGGQYDIHLTNSIFSTQVSDAEGSLMFTTENDNGNDNTFELRNIVLYDVKDKVERDGSEAITLTNEYTADPEFADTDKEDFTIGNTDYLTAGDNNTVLGATYWHPDFIDNFSDLFESTLSGIRINGEALEDFDSETLSYNVVLPAGSVIPTVTYDKTDADSYDSIYNATNLSGTEEERTTSIKITSSTGVGSTTYEIVFSMTSDDATLSDILINESSLNGFSSDVVSYAVDWLSSSINPVVSYVVNNDNATAAVTQVSNMSGSEAERTATIMVIAENNDTKTYTVLFTLSTTPTSGVSTETDNQWFYPTNVEDNLYMNITNDVSSINIYTISGKQVFSLSVSENGMVTLDLSELEKGMYIINAESSSATISGRFIKK